MRITSHTRLWCALREPRRGEWRGGLCARRFFIRRLRHAVSLAAFSRGDISPACVSVKFITPKGNQTWLAPCLAKHDDVGRSRRAAVQADSSTSAATRRRARTLPAQAALAYWQGSGGRCLCDQHQASMAAGPVGRAARAAHCDLGSWPVQYWSQLVDRLREKAAMGAPCAASCRCTSAARSCNLL